MYYRIIRNDILKSKLLSITTMVFVAAAAMLVSLAAILIINLTGSIDTMMIQAKTPHFMQMHAGTIDWERLQAFAKQNENVEDFQVLTFLNVDGAEIKIGENSLADSVQDNGFSTQSNRFDYLLDLDGKVIAPKDGELYVPICYQKDGTAKIGDKAVVCGKQFTVAGFLRDSQMNPSLSSSKRFLITKNDYAAIEKAGSPEYLIEFRLKAAADLNEFQTAYTAAGLEANGPTVTYPLFKMMNAVSDGLMIAVILLVSVLIVVIAFLCIRFTLLARIEDDYREIGTMKAIGMRLMDIKKIYLAKYAVITAAGCILGTLLSFASKNILLENIRAYMGESKNASYAQLFGIIGALLIFLTVIAYVNGVLNRFRKISAAGAIRFGISGEKASGAKHFRLSKNKIGNTNVFLGIKDVLTRKKLYTTMLIVLVFATFIIIVPQNMYHTISSKKFITYMGIGNCDMRIDIQQTDDISAKAEEIANKMEKDSAIARFAVLTTKAFTVKADDGTKQSIKIELGDHSVFLVDYLEGRAPSADNEIALSALNAEELQKKTGDEMLLIRNGKEETFTICGIYSDITNGGKTAKATFSEDTADIMWCNISAVIPNKKDMANRISEYTAKYDYAKVSDIDEYIRQTFGSTIRAIEKASYVSIVVSLLIAALITLLFIKMLIAKDRYSIAIMKAFGFTDTDITVQYTTRAVLVLLVGIIMGTVLANTVGEVLAGAIISSFGASSFQFIINPVSAYVLCPIMIAGAVLIAVMLSTADAGKIRIAENIIE